MQTVMRLVIATVQGLGGLLLLWLIGGELGAEGDSRLLPLYLLFLLAAIAGLVGALLLALDLRLGWQLSTAVQGLQVPQWASALIGYKLEMGVSVVAAVEYSASRLALSFDWLLPASAFRLYFGSSSTTMVCGVNLIALWFTVLLLRGYRQRFQGGAHVSPNHRRRPGPGSK